MVSPPGLPHHDLMTKSQGCEVTKATVHAVTNLAKCPQGNPGESSFPLAQSLGSHSGRFTAPPSENLALGLKGTHPASRASRAVTQSRPYLLEKYSFQQSTCAGPRCALAIFSHSCLFSYSILSILFCSHCKGPGPPCDAPTARLGPHPEAPWERAPWRTPAVSAREGGNGHL